MFTELPFRAVSVMSRRFSHLVDEVSVAGIEQLASDLLPSRQFGHIVLHLGAHENDRDVA